VNVRQTSKREIFCDARKAVKSVSGRGWLAPDLACGAYYVPSEHLVNCGAPYTIKFSGFSINKRLWQDVILRQTSQCHAFCDTPDTAGGAHDAPRLPIVPQPCFLDPTLCRASLRCAAKNVSDVIFSSQKPKFILLYINCNYFQIERTDSWKKYVTDFFSSYLESSFFCLTCSHFCNFNVYWPQQ